MFQMRLTRIFPIDVESIELVLLQKLDDALDENFSSRRHRRHRRKLLAALVPSSDGQGHLQMVVVDLQIGHATETAKAGILEIKSFGKVLDH